MVVPPMETAIVIRLVFWHEHLFLLSAQLQPFTGGAKTVEHFPVYRFGAITVVFSCMGRKTSKRISIFTGCCVLGSLRLWSIVRGFSTPCSTLLAKTLYGPKQGGELNCLKKLLIKIFSSPSLLLNFRNAAWLVAVSIVLRLLYSLMPETTETFSYSSWPFTSVRSSKPKT